MGLSRDTRGVVFVEFIIAFMPVFTMFLCAVQLSLLLATELAVEHAAVVGARAAMVVFEEDPKHYGGQPRRSLERAESERVVLESPLSSGASPPERSSRATAVRSAVALVLAPFAPAWNLDGNSLSLSDRAVGDAVAHWAKRLVFGLTVYPRIGLAVTYPVEPGSDRFHRHAIDGKNVTVRVTYLAPCQVPLAASLLCIASSKRLARGLKSSRKTGVAAELDALESPDLVMQALKLGARFAVFRAESTLPLQAAGYEGGAS